jgi:K+-transporting ATPase ATPase A chain
VTPSGIFQIVLYAGFLVGLGIPLGAYMARVYAGEAKWAQRIFGPVERAFYRLAGVRPDEEMTWKRYAIALVIFNVLGLVVVYLLQRLQAHLMWNPNHLPAVNPKVAWSTASSFATNTNWQAYGGETTMSHAVQMLALTVQNFLSAATGMAVIVPLARGFTRKHSETIGNFWVDLTRTTLYILIPLSVVLALVLVQQGVPQTLHGQDHTVQIESHEPQDIAVGPVASQVAIKQLGTNGGGYYNVNSAHPLENPTPLSNFWEMLAILLVPAALCFTFGRLVNSKKQGLAIFLAMTILFVPFLALNYHQESQGNPRVAARGTTGPNMEGKEVRFGIANSALWETATTAASNGSVNNMHDSNMPLSGASEITLIGLGEVVYGGVGSGLYGMVLFAVVAVFIAGLMVGRTPEMLGKKIEAREMKYASLGVLMPIACLLIGTALACMVHETEKSIANPGAHGFSEVLYAMTSAAGNNGSAFGGLTASGTFFATAQGIIMFVSRFWIIVPVLAMAGSLAKKKQVPVTAGTLPTDDRLFVFLLVGTVVLIGALTLIPALALGPIVEQLQL